jgi:hypothetical protein
MILAVVLDALLVDRFGPRLKRHLAALHVRGDVQQVLYTSAGIQKPDRSGLPSAVRRAGAFTSTFPSAVRGMFFQGYAGHCASAAAAIETTIASARVKGVRVAMLVMREV